MPLPRRLEPILGFLGEQAHQWPTPFDYQQAVMNPAVAFDHPSLSRALAVRNRMGLPQVSSGNFACVFKLQTGQRSSAVRCFLSQVVDQEHRYSRLGEHLGNFASSSLVDFEYIRDGIRVRGDWFPVVVMEWVEGRTLDDFVDEHIGDPRVMSRLAVSWRGLVAGLRGAYMAHGDLQHGNVMVDEHGRMYLVDYDNMFIASFAGESSPEIGHANYQHPGRTAADYDVWIDGFPALLIYLSLRALAVEPGLWRDCYNGENLILTRDDYRDPARSPGFGRLRRSPDNQVRELTRLLEDCCSGPISRVPYLESVLQGQTGASVPGPAANKVSKPSAPARPSGPPPPTNKVICPACGRSMTAGLIYCTSVRLS